MTFFELITRVNHFCTAKHFRGHGIHSPFLYDYIRSVVIKDRAINLVLRTEDRYWPNKTQFISSVDQINYSSYVAILGHPFRSRTQYKKWLVWRETHSCLSLHLKNYIIIFFDPRLPNQHFKVRS